MGFGDQLMQLMLIIVALLVALGGVTAWGRHRKSGGDSQSNPERSVLNSVADDVSDESGRSGMVTPSDQRHADRAERFDLTGKNAEAAAKVLKRMLQQDNQDGS